MLLIRLPSRGLIVRAIFLGLIVGCGLIGCGGGGGSAAGAGTGTVASPTVIPDDLAPIDLSGGRLYTNAATTCISSSGAFYCTGIKPAGMIDRYYGNLLPGLYRFSPEIDANLQDSTAISLGTFHACGIRNKLVYCWGLNHVGQLGIGDKENSETPQYVNISDIKQLAVGTFHSCALDVGGNVFCWGYNDYGQLGDGTVNGSDKPVRVLGLKKIIKITAGGDHTCALSVDGKLYCWGWNQSGQIGVNTFHPYYDSPTLVDSPEGGFVDVAAGSYHTCAVSSGRRLYCWGQNGRTKSSPRIFLKNNANHYSPIAVKSIEIDQTAIKIAFEGVVGDYTYCASGSAVSVCRGMDADGVVNFGISDLQYNRAYLIKAQNGPGGQLSELPELNVELLDSEFNNLNRTQPIVIDFKGAEIDVRWPPLGGGASYDLHYIADSGSGVFGGNYSVKRVSGQDFASLSTNAAVNNFSLYIDGAYLGVEDGQLGTGQYNNEHQPTLVANLIDVKGVLANYAETCALDLGGNLFCWGRTYRSNIPRFIHDGVSMVAMGGNYLCLSLANSQTLAECMGGNYYGQLGTGTDVDQSVFVKFSIPSKG